MDPTLGRTHKRLYTSKFVYLQIKVYALKHKQQTHLAIDGTWQSWFCPCLQTFKNMPRGESRCGDKSKNQNNYNTDCVKNECRFFNNCLSRK